MRSTRLTAAGAAAVLALGGTVAGASNTADQTVTIEVTAAARSITVGAPAKGLAVVAGATADDSTTSTLAYNAGAAAAKITAELESVFAGSPSTWTAELGELTLAVAASGMTGDAGTPGASPFTIDKDTKNSVAADTDVVDLVINIAANEDVTEKTITYTLAGTAPTDAVEAAVDIVFTITDDTSPA